MNKSLNVWLFTFLISVYLLSMGKGYYSTDGEVMLKFTWSLVEHKSIGFPCEERLPNAPPGRGGFCYSKYGIGHSLALMPFYLLGRNLRVVFTHGNPTLMGKWFADRANAVFTALSAVIIERWAFELFGNLWQAMAICLIYALSTPAWPYAKFNFNQPLTTLCLVAGYYTLWRYKDSLALRLILLSGISFAWLVLTRISDSIALLWVLPIFGKLIRKKSLKISHIVPWVFAILIAFAFTLGYNFYAFGKLLGGYAEEKWSTPIFEGLYGLLMSSGKGLFLFVPVSMLLPWALAKFYHRGMRVETVIFSGILVTSLAFYAPFWTWHGGWSWGPRFLVPVLPFIVLPLGTLLEDRMGRYIVFTLALTGFFVQILGVGVNFAEYMLLVNDETKVLFIPSYSPIVGHLSALLHQKDLVDLAPVSLEPFGVGKTWGKILLISYISFLLWSLKMCLKFTLSYSKSEG